MRIIHNSRQEEFRKPFGAATSNSSVRLRIAAEGLGIPESVQLCYRMNGAEKQLNMPYSHSFGDYSVYELTLRLPDETGLLFYCFKITKSGEAPVYYGNNYSSRGGTGELYTEFPSNNMYQITVYSGDYKTPEWFQSSVCYQIFPDRFYRPDNAPETERCDTIRRSWGDVPYYKAEQFGGEYLANDFFGGTLSGVEEKLPYLKELGISVIYLNPIFKAYSNHKYDTGDYEQIDPDFGTNADFERLCRVAKSYGIKIVLDGVFNHTGSNSRYFNKKCTYDSIGAYNSENSPYRSWFNFIEYPDVYESWWGIDTLPQVNENDPAYRAYILNGKNSIIKRWLRSGASGWRLDVADELPDSFLKELRREAKMVDENAVIIGEVWEDASNKIAYDVQREYLLGDELDSVMNYPLRNAIVDFAGGKISAEEFSDRLESLRENYPAPAFNSLLNFLSTHDIERALTVLGDVPFGLSKDEQAVWKLEGDSYIQASKRLLLAAALQILLPGVPCIFYGDEVGVQGFADPFCRRCYPWGHEDLNILSGYKALIAVRNSNDEFKKGNYNAVYAMGSVFAFVRFSEKRTLAVIVNCGDSTEIRLDLARFGTTELHSLINDEVCHSQDGVFFPYIGYMETKIFELK